MNTHTIHGRLTRDPEFTPRANSDGSDRANFTVAVDRRFGDETDFFDCVIFGKRAGFIDKYFHKGSEIALTGEGQIRSYTGKDGVKRKAYSIVISDFDFCGSRQTGSAPQQNENGDSWEQLDEDLPFDI